MRRARIGEMKVGTWQRNGIRMRILRERRRRRVQLWRPPDLVLTTFRSRLYDWCLCQSSREDWSFPGLAQGSIEIARTDALIATQRSQFSSWYRFADTEAPVSVKFRVLGSRCGLSVKGTWAKRWFGAFLWINTTPPMAPLQSPFLLPSSWSKLNFF